MLRKIIAGVGVTVTLLAGCGPLDAEGLGVDPPKSDGKGDSKGDSKGDDKGGSDDKATGTNPLDNPKGTEPGLGTITSDKDRKAARELIDRVATKGRGAKTGYDRDEFGSAWIDNVEGIGFGGNGCDTRNDLLKRDGTDITFKSGSKCIVIEMTIFDPYTGESVKFERSRASRLQIDHIMPLSYDWQMGASSWSDTKRRQIANDPLNLMPVNGSLNASKGDSGPATWLPPRKAIRCSYAVRFAQVSLKYELPVTAPDKQAMLDQCA